MEAYHTQLCMELQGSMLLFGLFNHNNQNTKFITSVDLGKNQDDLQHAIQKAFTDLPELKEDYKEFTLAISNSKSTLVPSQIFDVSDAASIYKLNFARKEGDIDYNRLPEMQLSVVYEINEFIKRRLVIKVPRTRIFHQTSILLKSISDDNVFKKKAYLHLNQGFFQLFIVDKTKLVFFNAFDFQSNNDIVYHLLFVLEQKEIPQDDILLRITGTKTDNPLIASLQKYFKKPIEIPDQFGEHFSLFSQYLCA